MIEPNDDGQKREPGLRFTLTAMFAVMLVASVMAAAGFYLARGIETGRQRQFAFVMFTLAAPVLLIVVVSSLLKIVYWINRRR